MSLLTLYDTVTSKGKSFLCPEDPCSALCPTWPNFPASWSPSMCLCHAHRISRGIQLLTSGPVAVAQYCPPIPLSLGVVKHLGSNLPHILGLAKAACLCPASFAGYSKRNWNHMGQIPPILISDGPEFGTKWLRAVERFLFLLWGTEHSHQGHRDDESPAKGAASALKV